MNKLEKCTKCNKRFNVKNLYPTVGEVLCSGCFGIDAGINQEKKSLLQEVLFISDKRPDTKQRKEAKRQGFKLKHFKVKKDVLYELLTKIKKFQGSKNI